MKIGFVIFDGMTALDFVGVYEFVHRSRFVSCESLGEKLAGAAARERISKQMDYLCYPIASL